MCVTKAISMLEQINDILQNTVITPYTATVKLLISFLLGAVIGIERQFRRREAGMRTFTLICMGSTADMLVNAINTEAMVNVRLSFGTIIPELKEVSQSYKEAGMALDVGRIFYPERNILSYRELGIGRLIHQLPVSLCEMFLEEVFAGNTVDQFDEETLSTVDKFFENSLNISETARQLFVHRNTLVYRLEKIQKQTGLDVRVFEDALTFKIALMVADHMKFIENRK